LNFCKNQLEEKALILVEKSQEIDQLKFNEQNLTELCEEKKKTIEMLKNSLMQKDSLHYSTTNTKSSPIRKSIESANFSSSIQNDEDESISVDSIMKIAQLQMRIKELEEKHQETEFFNEQLGEKEKKIDTLNSKLKENERNIKDLDMQIKLLKELREKDTKQHLKALSDMDSQLKKKSADAERCVHLLEQIRNKQERIQNLEGQFARIERQSNQERQTYEKQAHENWLNARKIEKELRETKQELNSAHEKLKDLHNENNQLKQKLATTTAVINPSMYYMSPHSTNNKQFTEFSPNVATNTTYDQSNINNESLNKSTTLPESNQQNLLQIETNSDLQQPLRPPSNASSSQSGGGVHVPLNHPIPMPPFPPNTFMRPFAYPPPPQMLAAAALYQQQQQQLSIDPNLSNPDLVNRLHPSSYYKMMNQYSGGRSASSSQQPSPGLNFNNLSHNNSIQNSTSLNHSFSLQNPAASNSFLNGNFFNIYSWFKFKKWNTNFLGPFNSSGCINHIFIKSKNPTENFYLFKLKLI
jgi:hypothetical protein